jgi:hypothetical protein
LEYGSPIYALKEIKCTSKYMYKDVPVCETEHIVDGWKDMITVAATNGKTIYIKQGEWLRELDLKHEYCHVQGGDETKCYLEMFR